MKKMIFLAIALMLCVALQQICFAEESSFVQRDELANVAMETYENVAHQYITVSLERPIFIDIAESKYGNRIVQAYARKFINGVGDKLFLPQKRATRLEMITVMYRVLNALNAKYDIEAIEIENELINVDNIPDWAINAVVYMVSAELTTIEEAEISVEQYATKEELELISDKIEELFVQDARTNLLPQ